MSGTSAAAADTAPRPIDLGVEVSPRDLHDIAHGAAEGVLGPAARRRMAEAAAVIDRMVAERRRVYGVTTGYGPLAGSYVAPDQGAALQRNLVYHLASGVGEPLPAPQARAVMAARVASLARGYSGVAPDLAETLLAMLRAGVTPAVPQMGTVGASGDLTPLAHIALAVMGEGEVLSADGDRRPAGPALRAAGIAPRVLGPKDGLALVNGTAAMTGIAALNAVSARRALDLGLRLAALQAEVMGAHAEAHEAVFDRARPHPGQAWARQGLGALLADSGRVRPVESPPPVLPEAVGNGTLPDQPLPQDPYTLRCVPQEFGAAADVLAFHDQVVTTEINSATDNPLVDTARGTVAHGGNFYGQHVAYASDALALALIKLAVFAERALARLTDPLRNGGLPAFLQPRQIGLQSGFMGAQVTATALVAEMRTLAVPASIQSIPTNADNQDVVTLGTIAARRARDLLGLLWRVLAIQAMALVQAAELRGLNDADGGFGATARTLADSVRAEVAPLADDRPLGGDIERLSAALAARDWD